MKTKTNALLLILLINTANFSSAQFPEIETEDVTAYSIVDIRATAYKVMLGKMPVEYKNDKSLQIRITTHEAEERLLAKLLSGVDSRLKVSTRNNAEKKAKDKSSNNNKVEKTMFLAAVISECKPASATVNAVWSVGGEFMAYRIQLSMEDTNWVCKSIELRSAQ